MVATNYNGLTVRVLGNFYQVSGITEVDGQTTTIGGPTAMFTYVPLSASIEGNVKGLSFAQMRPLINPNGIPDGSGFYLDVLPSGSSKGWFGSTPDLVSYFGPPLNQDEDDGPLPYADPFDPSWPLALAYVDSTLVTYNVPVVGLPTDKYGDTSVYTTSMPTSSSPIAPIVAPVRAPAIDSHSFFGDQNLNDLTPTISWTAPATGTPSEYIVQVCQWQTAVSGGYGCGQYATQVARVHTKATSVQIPPGILVTGNSYFLRISSRVQTGVDLEAAPYASAFPYGEAQALSGIITVTASGTSQSRVQRRPLSPSVRQRVTPPVVNARLHHI